MLHTKSSTRNVYNCIYLGNKQVSFNSDHICVNSFQIALNYLVSEVATLLLKRTSGIDVCYFYIYFFVLSVMFVCTWGCTGNSSSRNNTLFDSHARWIKGNGSWWYHRRPRYSS